MIKIAYLTILLLQGAIAKSPEVNTIQLRPEASVRGAEFTIGDIADVKGPRASDITKIRVGYTPAPGADRKVTPPALELKIASAGFTRNSYQIRGLVSVVRTETVTLSSKDIAAKVLSEAASRLPQNAILDTRGEIADFIIPAPPTSDPRVDLEVFFTKETAGKAGRESIQTPNYMNYRGDQSVEVRALSRGERIASVQIPVRIRYETEALVAVAAMRQGDSVDTARLTKMKVDITNLIGEPVTDAAFLAGRVLARAIAKDKILTIDDLTLAPVYKKGDQAQLIVQRGSLRIEAVVRVEGEAYPGSRVTVTCLEFAKTLSARVREDGTLVLVGDAVK
ncbi:MAG: flagellar basal body P-ring formation chaperone FlgA [Planctomycetota bacterium]